MEDSEHGMSHTNLQPYQKYEVSIHNNSFRTRANRKMRMHEYSPTETCLTFSVGNKIRLHTSTINLLVKTLKLKQFFHSLFFPVIIIHFSIFIIFYNIKLLLSKGLRRDKISRYVVSAEPKQLEIGL